MLYSFGLKQAIFLLIFGCLQWRVFIRLNNLSAKINCETLNLLFFIPKIVRKDY